MIFSMLLGACMLLTAVSAAYSYTGEAGPPMLTLNYGSRALSLGGAYSGVANDVYYMDSNPAGGDPRKVFKVSLIHQEWIEDVNYEAVRLSYGINDQFFFGLGFTYLYLPFTYYDYYGYSDGNSYTISQGLGMVNVGYKLKNYDFAFGANIKLFFNNVPEALYAGQNYLLFAGDIGVISRTHILKTFIGPEPSLTVGCTLKNIGYSKVMAKLPTEVHFGMSYRLFRCLLLTGEAVFPFYEPIFGSVGAEFDIKKTLFIQGGVQIAENPMFAVGLGYRRKDVNVNVSYTPSLAFRNMMSVSIEFTFGDTKEDQRVREIEALLVNALESFNDGNFKQALGYIEKVFELDSKNRRAKQLKKTTMKELELDKRAEIVNGIKG